MDTFNLHVETYLFAKFRNIWPKAIFHKDFAGSFDTKSFICART